jgi:hypothetical protein
MPEAEILAKHELPSAPFSQSKETSMRTLVVILSLAVLVAPSIASAEPTEITVRVLAKDSKFVGTSMGGMRIMLRDAHTGEILATG